MRLLIDGDIFAYRCAAAAENDDEGIARYYVDNLLDECIAGTGGDSYTLYLSGKKNYRYQIYPEYKANRLDTVRPKHLPYLRDYLIGLGAVVSDGNEADDLMGIEQCTATDDTVIVSLDKDMRMIPGKHYAWTIRGSVKGKKWEKPGGMTVVEELEGLRWFYTQCLTGDTADNIKGAAGVGKVGAAKLLTPCETEEEMLDAVISQFSCDEEFLMNARVLWIQRAVDDDYLTRFNKIREIDATI